MMKIETILTKKDYRSFYFYSLFKHKKLHWLIIIIWLPTLYSYWNGEYESTAEKIGTTLIATIMYLLVVSMVMVFFRLVLKFFKRNCEPTLGNHVFEINGDSFIEQNEITKTETKVSMFKKVALEKNHIFIMQKNGATFVVPRRSFTDREQEIEFLGLIKKEMA